MCQEELRKEKREREQMEQEKEATICDLHHKMDNLETDYEKVLHVSYDTNQIKADTKNSLIQRKVTHRCLKVWPNILEAPYSINLLVQVRTRNEPHSFFTFYETKCSLS